MPKIYKTMTSGQKVAFSLLISVLAFCAFTVVAFSGLFDLLEVNFYQPVVQEIKEKKISEIATAQNEYFQTLMKRFDTFILSDEVKTYADTRPSDSDVRKRELRRSQLAEATSSLKGIRIVAENGRNVYFSTFSSDLISGKKGITYKNYDGMDEISYDSVASDKSIKISDSFEKKCRIIKDGDNNQLIFSIPFFNSKDEYSGTALFYCDSTSFSQFLLNRNLIDVSGFARLVTTSRNKNTKSLDNFGGFVFGMPNFGQSSLKTQLLEKWRSTGDEKFWKLIPEENPDIAKESSEKVLAGTNENLLCVFSHKAEREDFGFISFIYDESELKFPPYMRILLLVTAFVTLYLAVFLILSFKHDDIVVIRDKVRRYENEFFIGYKKMGEPKNPAYLAEQKPVLERRILKSLGRKGEKHASEFKSIFEGYWNEMLASFGDSHVPAGVLASAASMINADELKEIVRSSLEDILENGKIQINATAVREVSGGERTEVRKPVVEGNPEPSESEAVEEVAAAEEISEADEVESLEDVEDAESVEEIGEAELADDVEEADSVEAVDEAEAIEELDEVEEVAEADEVESLEEVEDAETVDDVEDAEIVEELGEVEEITAADEIEDIEAAESVDEIDEIEEVAEVDEVESLEEVEDAESVEEIGEAELADDVEEAESVEAVDEAEAIEELDEIEEVAEADEVESLEEVEDAETVDDVEDAEIVEELGEVEEVAEVDEVESLEEVDDAESVEEIGEAELADDVEEADSVEAVDEAEAIEELDEIEEVSEAEEVESLEEVEDAEEVGEIEEAESAEDIEEIEDAEPAEEVDDVESVDEIEEVAEVDAVEELDEVESVETVEEPEAVEELDEVEEVSEADEVESLEEVEDAESVEDAEAVEEIEEADDVESLEEVEDAESVEEPIEDAESLDLLPEVDEREYKKFDMERTLAALPEQAPGLIADDDTELDNDGLSRKPSASEMHDIQKLKDVAKVIEEKDAELEELEVFDPELQNAMQKAVDIDYYAPHITDSNVSPDDDIYRDEALLEKIEFGVPNSDIPENEVDDSIADDFVVTAMDFSFLDDEDTDEKLYGTQPPQKPTESEHFFRNPELVAAEQEAAESKIEDVEPAEPEEVEAELTEVESLEPEVAEAEPAEAEELEPELADVETAEQGEVENELLEVEPLEPEEVESVELESLEPLEPEVAEAEPAEPEELEPEPTDVEIAEPDELEPLESLEPEEAEEVDFIEEDTLVPVKDADNIEEADELELLEEPEETMPFTFTKFAAAANSDPMELDSGSDDAIVQDKDGTFRVTAMSSANSSKPLNMEFKKLVDSILR